MSLELDYMEYANDAAAQAAYVTDASDLIDSFSEANKDSSAAVNSIDRDFYGQAITLGGPKVITGGKFYLAKAGTVSGNCTARIYAAQGTVGTNAYPTGGILAESDPVAVSGIPVSPSFSLIEFTFSTPYVASAGDYCIVLVYTQTGDPNTLLIGIDSSSPSHGGNACDPAEGKSAIDCCFYLYGVPDLQCYSESTIKSQGSYSLKVTAKTASLNKTLTKTLTGGDKIDLSGINTLEIDFYASRTGANIEVRIHDSGGTTTTKSIAISSADAWDTTTWDISGVADVNKDDIDQIIIKITNADALNAFYVDNFYGVILATYPIPRLNKNRISGFHCFMDAFLRAKRTGFEPLKLPDGSVF